MVLLRFFKPEDGLLDPKRSLSLSVPSRGIASANGEVLKLTSEVGKKRGLYRRCSPEEHFEIGRYANDHGIAAARSYVSILDILIVKHFSLMSYTKKI